MVVLGTGLASAREQAGQAPRLPGMQATAVGVETVTSLYAYNPAISI